MTEPLQCITYEDYLRIAADCPYYVNRWDYFQPAIMIINNARAYSALEIGCYKYQLIPGSDTMDLAANPEFDYDLTYEWDATKAPWPITDKEYDIAVALQVWEHLGDQQAAAFAEVQRVACRAVISFPLNWDCPDDPVHHAITREKIAEWTLHCPPVLICTVGEVNTRALYLFHF